VGNLSQDQTQAYNLCLLCLHVLFPQSMGPKDESLLNIFAVYRKIPLGCTASKIRRLWFMNWKVCGKRLSLHYQDINMRFVRTNWR